MGRSLLLTFIILIFFGKQTLAQNAVTIRLNGVVIDSESNDSLEYAHIGFTGSNLGTVSNSLGQFSLIIPPRYLNDTLVVSYIGYESLGVAVSGIDSIGSVEFRLKPDPISLPEITIKSNQRSIVEEAVAAIPENYDLDEMVLDGFWRAQIYHREQAIQLSESAFEIYRIAEKRDKKEVMLKLLKGRISRDSAAFADLFNIQAGVTPRGLTTTSFLVGHPLLSKKTLKNHDYEISDITSLNGRLVYVVEFDKKSRYKKTGYSGTMLIDVESLAFVQISYDLSASRSEDPLLFGNSSMAGMLLGLGTSTLNKSFTELNYYEKDGRWYLSHARYDAAWTLSKPKRGYLEPMTYYADFIITDIQKQDVRAPSKDELAKNQILENQFSESADNFWEDYTYLVPDKDFDRMFEQIRQRGDKK